MKSNIPDNDFELTDEQQKISQIYQESVKRIKTKPSQQLDQAILNLAQQHLSNQKNSDSLPKSLLRKSTRMWHWSGSIAASVVLMSVLFITQQNYFYPIEQPQIAQSPSLKDAAQSIPNSEYSGEVMQELESDVSSSSQEVATDSFKQAPQVSGIENVTVAGSKKRNVAPTSARLSTNVLSSDMFRDSKELKVDEIADLAEKIEFLVAKPHTDEQFENIQLTDMQQRLFNLLKQQQLQSNYIVPKNYLKLLTKEQVQQLTQPSITKFKQ